MNDDSASIISATLEDIGIVAGRSIERDYPLTRARLDVAYCPHRTHVVDGTARVVQCKACGVALDPIKCIEQYAADPAWILHARKERAALEKEIDALKQERLKLRAAKRRAKT